jgi:hypothetical protein
MNEQEYFMEILQYSDYEEADIVKLVKEKQTEYGNILGKTAVLALIYKDLNISLVKSKQKNKIKEEPKMENKEKVDAIPLEASKKYALTTMDEGEALPIRDAITVTHYPSEEEVLFLIKRRKFVKEKLIDSSDKVNIKGKQFLKKSAWRKYINAFGISIDMLKDKVEDTGKDIIAECTVKATAPNGQFVVAVGTKSKSEYWSEKGQDYGSYTLHNLKATARTRAINIAVSDLVGYGETSAEELSEKDQKS